MTLHETAYERKRNAQSYLLLRLRLLSLQRRKTRDAQRRLLARRRERRRRRRRRRRSHHLSRRRQRRVFVSRSLSLSRRYSFFARAVARNEKGKKPKKQTNEEWTLSFDDGDRQKGVFGCCVWVPERVFPPKEQKRGKI